MKNIDKPLLNKNKIVVQAENSEINKDEFYGLIGQTPNKRLLGVWRFKLWANQLSTKGKERKFKNWMSRSFGESPVFFDTQITQKSIRQMEIYLNKTGHFNSKVWYESIAKRKKLNLIYHIKPTKPYKIKSYNYQISDSQLYKSISRISTSSLIIEGDNYNAFIIDDERDRITDSLKNIGYYNFDKEYIYFEIDSAFNSNSLDITLTVKDLRIQDTLNPEQTITIPHKHYYINNIYINPDFALTNADQIDLDTLAISVQEDTNNPHLNTYHFLHKNELQIKPKVITQSILISTERLYSLETVKQTYRRLADLKVFRYTNIQFATVVGKNNSANNLLDCYINLEQSKVQSYTVEAEGTNSGGDLGLGGNIVYANKNFFKGAELFQVRIKGALEVQKMNSSTANQANDKFLFFNTLETGIEVSLNFPRFLIPIKQERFSKGLKPTTTTVNTGINYQQRPQYRRYITNVSFGYNWSQNSNIQHILFPVEVNSVKVYPTAEFEETLELVTDERLKNQYTDHLISALKYSFIFNNQELNKLKNFIYFRANFETSGLLLKGVNMLSGIAENDDGYNTLFNIRYAQYVRADIDFRYYDVQSKENRLVFRGMLGVGIPYGNSVDIPFEKGFYAGGANGMRGWRIRSLGPGSSDNDDSFSQVDRIGDLQLEANIEYRFPIHSFVKGAVYMDMGNVWLLKENDFFPRGHFQLKRFFSEIAFDAGFGLRFDFNFFIFRIDTAIRLRDPSLEKSHRWVAFKTGINKMAVNFGIGYPF
ncbi:MAG: BamA/TamA family outer membrane protein [Bacteroidetes bacterium]|nr:BamA/TamA family outer membrane protein [Bacteroidota bacterium]